MEVDIEMVVDEEDDEVQNENDLEMLEGNDNDELTPSDDIEMVDSDDETYDPANLDTYEDYF
jgi:capsid protein